MDPMTPPRAYPALTPLDFLERAARMFSDRVAVIDGEDRLTYAELHDDVSRQAAALTALGVKPGDRVAVLAPNTHGLLEAHYSVPWCGAVLVALNARLNARELAAIGEHAGAALLLYDEELADVAAEIACAQRLALDALVKRSRDEAPAERAAAGEYDLLSLNYTSGTTGRPKGVMYHHRGAFLQALAMAYHARLAPGSAYLWTLRAPGRLQGPQAGDLRGAAQDLHREDPEDRSQGTLAHPGADSPLESSARATWTHSAVPRW